MTQRRLAASDRSFSSSLRSNTSDPANCTYGGIAERGGRTTTAPTVKVGKDSCHVITEQLTMALT